MKKYILTTVVLLGAAVQASAVNPKTQVDTTGLYSDQSDTLAAATVRTGFGNYLSKGRELRTEVISAAGLCKMACCNLAESFENSASVTVGYSDAVTGARQIRLLGLSGVYTQMLDENRPIMRGIAAPFGLGYVPGQWLSSIQIAKGAPSVINGVESITGQINLEHRKPTDEIPFFLNAAIMSDTKMDLNLASSLQLGNSGKWSTVILGHVSGNLMGHDMDMKANGGAGTGFLAEPQQMLINLGNRWLYYGSDGTQVRFGVRFLRDTRAGGQYDPASGWRHKAGYDYAAYKSGKSPFWGSSIINQGVNAYLKVGVPLNPENSRNVAFVGDFNDYSMNSSFGTTLFNTNQISGFANLLYQDQSFENHHFTVGLTSTYDRFNEQFDRPSLYRPIAKSAITHIANVGAFGEYTFHYGEAVSVIAGLRADWYNIDRKPLRVSPRLTARFTPIDDQLVIRLNAGRGLRYANPLADNLGVLSTNKYFFSEHNPASDASKALFLGHPMEDAWVAGGNITWYMPWERVEGAYLSFDYFRTQFVDQLIVDYNTFGARRPEEATNIDFYMLGGMSGGKSFTDTYQVDFSIEPVKRFTVSATFRYTNAKLTMVNGGLQERPMVSKYKGVLNLQYATNLNKWIFDVTASVNGPCRLYDFMGGGYSQVYPLLYAQITHRMKGWDLYIGGENLTNFKQKDVIIGDPGKNGYFDASCVWGPLMGIKGYIGIRVTLWKKS